MSVKIVGGISGQQVETDISSSAMRVITYDITGQPYGQRYTFDAATPEFQISGSGVQDVAMLSGSLNKLVRVTRVRFQATQYSIGVNSIFLVKRSTINTGGSPFTASAIQRDTTSPTASAIMTYFSASGAPPTIGTPYGIVRSAKFLTMTTGSSTSASNGGTEQLVWDFDDWNSHPVYLRGPGQSLAVSFSGSNIGVAPASMSAVCSFTWTES